MNTGNKPEVIGQGSGVKKNKKVIFYITDNALRIAERLKGLYRDARVMRFKSEALSEVWDESGSIIFIMATGIVVRTIAPLIRDKRTDPAVVVIDERGRFAISLLSGHIGGGNALAEEIARYLNGQAVITTASDVNGLMPVDIWAIENGLFIENREVMARVATRYINNNALRVYSDVEMAMPEEFLRVSEPGFADVIITNKSDIYLSPEGCPAGACRVREQLYLRPKNLVVGIGCNKDTSVEEIEDVVKSVLNENNLSFHSIYSIATIDIKLAEPGLKAFAERHGLEIKAYNAGELNTLKGIKGSETVFNATGAFAVSEPAALLGAKTDKLLVKKQKRKNVTVAIAELRSDSENQKHTPSLYIVGTGPGGIEHITPCAREAIRRSDVIVGYGTYLELIQDLIEDKEVISTGMTQEVDRCKKAVELARSGKTVSVISGGDPGIYAMAGLVFEILKGQKSGITNQNPIDVEVIPGISAINACAARLGAPLMHDFAVISLSDRLTPWDLIEKRLIAAAMADFVTVIYNPKSKGRQEQINKAREIFLRYRETETPVGIVKGAMREDESVIITNLRDMLNYEIDMQTTVIIGNSQTFVWNGRMITPRGYEKKMQQ